MHTRHIIVLMFFFLIFPVRAEENSPIPASISKAIETFHNKLKVNDFDTSLDTLYVSNPWIAKNEEAIQKLKTSFVSLPSVVGPFYEAEYIRSEVAGGHFIVLYYLAIFDRQPLVFQYSFYRPKDNWLIYSFSFNADLDSVIQKK